MFYEDTPPLNVSQTLTKLLSVSVRETNLFLTCRKKKGGPFHVSKNEFTPNVKISQPGNISFFLSTMNN